MSEAVQAFQDAWNLVDPPRRTVVAIGNFDGVHRGQQEILARVVRRAERLETQAGVVTFEPHPLTILVPEKAPPRLTSAEQKLELLVSRGIERIFVVRFDDEFAGVSATEFVRHFLVERLAVLEVHVGSRFVFGNARLGDLQLLRRLGQELGFSARGLDEVNAGEQPISSTRIRGELLAGRVREAQALLGRPHAVTGTVSRGDGRGRGLGWPTINLEGAAQMLPASGVYATRVSLAADGLARPSVTNVGRRPTFDPPRERVVESHILDYEGDSYDLAAEVRFLERLREERVFESPRALADQISLDVAAAREYFRTATC